MTRNYVYFTIVFTLAHCQICLQKNPDLIGFFKIKSKHPDGLKKRDLGEKKTSNGSPVTRQETEKNDRYPHAS